jgi:iron complex transport system permease protein
MLIGLLGISIISLRLGPVDVDFASIWKVLVSYGGVDTSHGEIEGLVLHHLRIPRILIGGIVGMALGTTGAVMQGLFRNPMADPGIIGVSAGGALGGVLAISVGITGSFPLALPLCAFFGALLTSLLVYGIGLLGGRFNMATLLLAGVAVNSFIGALISAILVSIPTNDSLREVLFWLAGGIGGNGWSELQIVFPFIFAGIFAFVIFSRDLNVLMMGGDDALTLGVNPKVMRPLFLVAGALVTGAAVAVSGIIAFVGLVVPHIVRLMCGPDNRILIPISGIAGAIFVIAADTIARTVIQPAEYRVGIITAFVGAPFFIFLLIRNQKRAQIFQ